MSRRPAAEEVVGATKFYRPPYEIVSAFVAFLAALVYVYIGRYGEGQISLFVGYMSLPLFVLSAYRAYEAFDNLYFKTRLTTPLPPFTTVENLLGKQASTNKVWLGKGFNWEPYHARVMKEIATLPVKSSMEPPRLFRKLMQLAGRASPVPLEGHHYIHGVGEQENDLFVSYRSRTTHTLLLGTNGSGKTRALESLIAQSIARGALPPEKRAKRDRLRRVIQARFSELNRQIKLNPSDASRLRAEYDAWHSRVVKHMPSDDFGPVIIIDPKSDLDLLSRAYQIAKRYGREGQFRYFAPTRPNCSFRINPLANYSRLTELANRVAALMPSGGQSETFKQFAWRAVNVVVSALQATNTPITLVNLKRYIDGGLGELLAPCLDSHFQSVASHYPDWRSRVDSIRNRTSAKDDLAARMVFYSETVRRTHPDIVIDGIIQVLEHDSAHYTKLISNLIPVLEQLTSGDMQRLLSPSYPETDPVCATNFQHLIDSNCIVYVNLDSLADSVVGSALGSLFLADLTACAARRHANGINHPPVAVYVDEAAEVINDPLIQLLNKGRSSGFEVTLASQTVADFVARMGDQAKALQVLGNVNCTIAMRVLDEDSLEMVTAKFSETNYAETSSSRSSTTIAAIAQRGRDYSGSVMKGTQSKDLSLVDPDLLRSLPPGHFFGHFPGGDKIKGRVLLMPDIDKQDQFDPHKHGQLFARPAFVPLSDSDESSTKTRTISLDQNPSRYYAADIKNVPLPAT